MATIDQAPPTLRPPDEGAPNTVLNNALARVYTLNWEAIFYIAIFALAVFTRFVNLGDRVMSHDESLHTKYSFDLYKQGLFEHTPLMHGPILFHMTALSYFLFGDSDFSARLYPAVLGILMVMMPKLLFERWLGKFGAMAASIFILISPMLLFHHRYIREDTPAIFYTMLMVYAFFAYVDGVRPKQVRWLVLFAAATLLNLGSKETAFMYILIFAVFIGLFLLIQMIQGWRVGAHSPAVGWATVGVVGVPLAGIAGTVAVALLNITPALPESINIGPLVISRDVMALGATLALGIPTALAVGAVAVFVYRFLWLQRLRKPALDGLNFVALRGNSLYKLVLTGVLIGTVAALVMTNVLSIITPESVRRSQEAWSNYAQQQAAGQVGAQPVDLHPNVLLGRLFLWTAAMVLTLTAAVSGTAIVKFRRLPRLPWVDIAFIAFTAAAVCLLLIFFEERSRLVPNVSSEVRPVVTEFKTMWIFGPWVIGVLAIAGILWLRWRTTFWQEMRRYAAFDILIVLGSLVLPWVAALPIFLAGYQLDKSTYTQTEINAMLLAVTPFVAVSIVAGLCWRSDVWLICAATFYGIFAFFFTTVFTNAEGVATGIVGSLGYWLAQQGVRRGSQPQYYYMLIQLPIYEYLALIGAAFAGVTGLAIFWRFRAGRIAAVNEARREAREAQQGGASQPAQDFALTGATSAPYNVPEHTPAAAAAETQPNAANSTATLEELVRRTAQDAPQEDDLEYYEAEAPPEKKKKSEIPEEERLERPLFLVFTGLWGLLILMALTLAGEKMPWLTTHITLPLLLLAGWYVGLQLEKINWQTFWRHSWALVVLIPVFVVGLVNVVGPVLLGRGVLSGLTRDEQLRTFAWFGAIILAGLTGYAIFRIWRLVGAAQLIRVGVVGLFVLVGALTARTAWMAAYINYDNATEFMVYAHAAPANKTVMNYIEDISRRTTDGMNIKVGYDNEVSWPGSWYFRNYPNGRYLGDLTGATGLDEYVALVVGDNNSSKIESQLAEKFYRFDLIRLWWPMQEYFNLTLKRIDDAFSDAEMRQALWEIWWNRDYTRYTSAYSRMTGNTNVKFTLDKWPVSDRMIFYVRKDVAAQIWDFGIGAARVTGLPEDPFKNLRCDTCSANLMFSDTEVRLTAPRGVAVGPEGDVYVADSQNARVVVFDTDGQFKRQFGSLSVTTDQNPLPAPGTFREPWGIAVGRDGTIYVADTWNHRVQVFANDGTPQRQWGIFERVEAGQPGTNVGFYGPRDIEVDAENNVYVADTGNKRVRVYKPDGTFLYDIGQMGREPGQLFEPVGLAINDRTREIFVASTWNKRIDVFALSGQFLRSWTLQAWFATTETTDSGNRPFIALDPTGTYLFVTDPDQGRVLVYDTNGTPVLSFGRLGVGTFSMSQFGRLGGIATNSTGHLILADAESGRILRFAPNALPGLVTNPPDDPSVIGPMPATQEATTEPTSDDF